MVAVSRTSTNLRGLLKQQRAQRKQGSANLPCNRKLPHGF